jgi:hypothetical protein
MWIGMKFMQVVYDISSYFIKKKCIFIGILFLIYSDSIYWNGF